MKTYGVYRGFGYDMKDQIGFFVNLDDAKKWLESQRPDLAWSESGDLICGYAIPLHAASRVLCSIKEFDDDVPDDMPSSTWGKL